ncbi:unnamed protein product [marine sediment metagenome]|uniref:Uncharacterized protein n=1 Tax=marine sediment metagenome TaxID=412755 RepID=X1MFB1_9ZZZZ
MARAVVELTDYLTRFGSLFLEALDGVHATLTETTFEIKAIEASNFIGTFAKVNSPIV